MHAHSWQPDARQGSLVFPYDRIGSNTNLRSGAKLPHSPTSDFLRSVFVHVGIGDAGVLSSVREQWWVESVRAAGAGAGVGRLEV